MNIFQRVPVARWIAPAAVVAVIIGGGAAVRGITAASTTSLPARSAAQLLVDVEQASVAGVSGTVVQTADLGIPSLPGIGGSSSSDLTSLISGTHTLRVWYAGPEQVRIALLGTLGESDVVRNGKDLWTWSSQNNTATHRTLSDHHADGAAHPEPLPITLPTSLPASPQDAAAAALAAIGPSTTVTTETGATVAGRPAYELVLKPKDSGSLVSQVRIAIDAAEHIPLSVGVFAVGHTDPALQIAFTSVDFGRPDAAEFTFNPPPGATVTDAGKPTISRSPDPSGPSGALQATAATADPRVVGSGWTSVLVADSSALGATGASTSGQDGSGSQLNRILGALPTVSGAWGSGHLLAGTLFSVLVTDAGKVAVGAVQPDLLYAALQSK